VIRICSWAVPPGDAHGAGTTPGPGRNGGTMPQVREPCQRESAAGPEGGGPGRARDRMEGQPRCTPPGATIGVESGERGYAATTWCSESGNGSPAGGLWARAGQSPRWVRIFSMTAGCSMKAMIRMAPRSGAQQGIGLIDLLDQPRPLLLHGPAWRGEGGLHHRRGRRRGPVCGAVGLKRFTMRSAE